MTYDSQTEDVVVQDHGFDCEAHGSVHRVSPKVARVLGFDGYMSLRHMCLLAQLLRELRYETAYRRNGSNHRPWGEVVTRGFWKGEVHIDVQMLPRCAP